jgi:hypothetical protein
VLLPESLSATSDDTDGLHAQFIAVDETGQRIFALTVLGLTIVQLVSVPLGIGTASPASGPAVTVRGSGFQSGAIATLGGNSVTTSFRDANTILLTTVVLTVSPCSSSNERPGLQ